MSRSQVPPIDPARIGRRLQAVFAHIHHARMAGLPIVHPGLSVAVVGARHWQQDWAGVLVTPWCMNLVLIPGPGSDLQPGTPGSKQWVALPAGEFELIASEERGIGPFGACSLFSPMQAFVDQAAALATAEAVMQQLFEPPPAPEPAAPASVSRRALLRGDLGRA